MKAIGYFSKRLDEIFKDGNPTKAQIIDTFHKSVTNRLPSIGDAENEAEFRHPIVPHMVDWNNGKNEGFVDGAEWVLDIINGNDKIRGEE